MLSNAPFLKKSEAHPDARRRTLVKHSAVGAKHGSGVRPIRSRMVGFYTDARRDSTMVCADESDR